MFIFRESKYFSASFKAGNWASNSRFQWRKMETKNSAAQGYHTWTTIPANTGYSPNAASMLVHRLRRWPSIETTLGEWSILAGMSEPGICHVITHCTWKVHPAPPPHPPPHTGDFSVWHLRRLLHFYPLPGTEGNTCHCWPLHQNRNFLQLQTFSVPLLLCPHV